ncbi:hypothetical protein [Carboxylicivirga sp. RSCT41]|uniref:hypothetical protein n=1 Tax=Carboxylicivirga agarovorans TaxID=3417570 RepID=UPI003D32A9F3
MRDIKDENTGLFKKYLLPVLLGILALATYYMLIEEYNLNKGDFIGAILVVALLVIELINNQKGPDIPIPWLDKVFKYYLGKKENDAIKPDFNINEYVDNDSFIISYSKSKLWFNFFGLITMTLLGGYFLSKEGLYVISVGIAYVMGRGIYTNWDELGDDSPKIVMKKDGIATPQIGFVKWEAVKLIQFRDTSSSETESTNLDIFLTEKEKWKHPEYTIMIDHLNKSKKEMSRKITELKGTKPNNV